MSWYFFGGFSAYLIVPSGRWWNHSGCSRHPGMVRRALERVVERDLDPVLAARRARNARKSSSVPRAGSIALCPPCSLPMAHGEPGSSGPAVERVVASLPEAPPDRVDRRQVDHVEAHRRDLRQPLDAVAEGPVAARHPALGAREHLVPGGEPGQRPVDDDLELPVVPRRRRCDRDRSSRISATSSSRRRRARRSASLAALELGQSRASSRRAIGAHDAREGAPQERRRPRGARS